MRNRGTGRVGRALRHGVALGLALTAAWGVSLTADFGGVEDQLAALGERPSLAVALMAAKLGELPGEGQTLAGWGRLLLKGSPLLRLGEDAVLKLNAQPDSGGGPEPEPPDSEEEDVEQPDLQPSDSGEGIVEMTGRGKEGSQYLSDGGLYVYNRTEEELDASLLQEGAVDVPLGEGPQILIVHTHGSEAYSMTDGDTYEESDPYRTTDCSHNVVRVGEEMATVFRAYGFQVVHDTTLCDYPAYNGAYDRSKAVVEQWLAQYPTIKVVLDVHRDALVGSEGEIYKMVTTEAGQKVAQVMMVLGTDASGADHPRWKDNLAFALRLQKNLIRGYTSLARPTVLRRGRYNQHLSPGAILVEVGGHGNTLSEAIAGGRLWADSVARTLLDMKE